MVVVNLCNNNMIAPSCATRPFEAELDVIAQ